MAICSHSQKEQVKKPSCLTDVLMNNLIKENPELKSRLAAMDIEIAKSLEEAPQRRGNLPPPILTIPVVFYVVADPGAPDSNVSDNRVLSQLAALNANFTAYNLNFCLATKAGQGNIPTPTGGTQITPGIIHVNNATLSNHNSATEGQNLVDLAGPVVNEHRYLRIWIVNTIDGLDGLVVGYSMFPNSTPVFDGIVLRHIVVGNESDPLCDCVGDMMGVYDQGKVLVHEVGHYLGLHHTFNESCTGGSSSDCNLLGDRVCDTPPVNAPNYYCITDINSCNETYPSDLPDNIHNYMDYTDNQCAYEFTAGQKDRMFYMLNTYRAELFSTANILYTQTCGFQNLVSADFTPSTYSPCQGASVTFNATIDASATYHWDFGDGSFGSGQSVSHAFAAAATPYTVTLTAYKATVGTSISSVQVFVSVCSIINNQDSNWYLSYSHAINFSTGVPLFINSFPTNRSTPETSVSESSSTGSWLFYGNRNFIYRASDNTPINSVSMAPATQWVRNLVSVPSPSAAGQYYLFYNSYLTVDPPGTSQGFRYSIVNTSGTMSMVANRVPITQPSGAGYIFATDNAVRGGSGVAAISRCGNRYWILTVNIKNNVPHLSVYALNPGIAAPQFSSEVPLTGHLNGLLYNIEVAPNGNKVLIYCPTQDSNFIYDFDKTTGILSNPRQISTGNYSFGATFSPDSNLLYVVQSTNRKIYQYNLNSMNLNATKAEVGSISSLSFENMEIGPDGKIYIVVNAGADLSVIHSPNALVSAANPNACNFSTHGPGRAVNIGGGRALPNNIDAEAATAYPAASANFISAYRTGCNSYKFFPNRCDASYSWRFTRNSTGTFATSAVNTPDYSFPAAGAYTVTLRSVSNPAIILATYPTITIPTLPLPVVLGSTTSCTTSEQGGSTNNSVALSAGQTALWTITGGAGTISSSSTGSDVTVFWTSLPGTLSLTVTDAAGCSASATRTITSQCSCDCLAAVSFTALPSGPNLISFSVANPGADALCGSSPIYYYWNFGDGTFAYGTPATRSHTYAVAGTYVVTMQARLLGEFDQILCEQTFTGNVSPNNGIIAPVERAAPAVNENIIDNSISVFPNPATSLINVALVMEKAGLVKIAILGVDGKQLSENRWYLEAGSQTMTLDLPQHIDNGLILLKIDSQTFSTIKKIIISK